MPEQLPKAACKVPTSSDSAIGSLKLAERETFCY